MVAKVGMVGVGEEMEKKPPNNLLPFLMNLLKDLQHQIVFKTRKRNRGTHDQGPTIKHIHAWVCQACLWKNRDRQEQLLTP